ncbi:MAG: ATP-dependent helicase [Lachnospiraceae bacterium]|nr:ATP-dependent helicase [Lachnospiraceae bacterium]
MAVPDSGVFMSDYSNLDPFQLSAVLKCDENVMLAAGPGSGKTHTMTQKIIHLTGSLHIDPSSILVITFTKDAALSMMNRFNKCSGFPLPVAFGTFHSVFYHMIREHGNHSGIRILLDKNKKSIAESTVRKFMGNAFLKDDPDSVRRFLHSMSVFKNSLDAEKAGLMLGSVMNASFPDMLRYYEGIRRKAGLLDFDDMVYDCLDLLKKDTLFRSKWTGRFRYILIDEFQDINPAQYETVSLLSAGDTKIFAVGDDDQSIYGFRGSDPSMIGRFMSEKNAVLMHLNTNYRSLAGIVNASLVVINENPDRIRKDLVSAKKETGTVTVSGFEDKDAQYRQILHVFDALEDKSSAAVLFRTNICMQTFASFLASENRPFSIREKSEDIFEHFIIRDIYSYLSLAYGTGDESDIKNIINKPLRHISSEALMAVPDQEAGLSKPQGADTKGFNVQAFINDLISVCMDSPCPDDSRARIHGLKCLKKDLMFMHDLSPSLAISYLLGKTGYGKYVTELAGHDQRKKEEYQKILDLTKEISSKAACMNDMTGLRTEYARAFKRSKMASASKDAIKLMTVHASKGLEFETVFIPDCNEGTFPHGKMPDNDAVSEERRIFYVAMTRAVSGLHIFYVKGLGSEPRTPSRFLCGLIK